MAVVVPLVVVVVVVVVILVPACTAWKSLFSEALERYLCLNRRIDLEGDGGAYRGLEWTWRYLL